MSDHNRSDAAHQAARAALPAYAAVIALGQNAEQQHPEVAAHVHACPECRAYLAELLPLVELAYSGQVVPSLSVPSFDMSFLPSNTMSLPQKIWWLDPSNQLMVTFPVQWVDEIRQPAALRAVRGGPNFRYQQPAEAPYLFSFTLEFAVDPHNPQMVRLELMIDRPEQADPLEQAGVPVRLWGDDNVWEAHTDDLGVAVFTEVPLDSLPQMRLSVDLSAGAVGL